MLVNVLANVSVVGNASVIVVPLNLAVEVEFEHGVWLREIVAMETVPKVGVEDDVEDAGVK